MIFTERMTAQERAEAAKELEKTSRYNGYGREMRTQKLTLSLRPSIIQMSRRAVKDSCEFNSLTDFIEYALEKELKARYEK